LSRKTFQIEFGLENQVLPKQLVAGKKKSTIFVGFF
jgi:hypothetical protein